ncbi:MAG: exodeoxyribonuclease VII small subunit [Bacteroidales bacterium]|jgi:exodeoxyribonuclease VII small subunit|nr:exodeoxyribonuclease VII small subunit [Bacteroidales bacterium]HPH53157.1 exodeoxyribonuclease VII small subunit [Bacteroidales bacterium]
MKEKMSYEEAYTELERLVTAIEDPERDLSGIENDVKRAMELIQYCKDTIRGEQEKIETIINKSDNSNEDI